MTPRNSFIIAARAASIPSILKISTQLFEYVRVKSTPGTHITAFKLTPSVSKTHSFFVLMPPSSLTYTLSCSNKNTRCTPGTPRKLTEFSIVFSSWRRKTSSSTVPNPSSSLSPPPNTRQRMTSFSELSSLQMTKRSVLKLSAIRPATYAMVSFRSIILARSSTSRRSHGD